MAKTSFIRPGGVTSFPYVHDYVRNFKNIYISEIRIPLKPGVRIEIGSA